MFKKYQLKNLKTKGNKAASKVTPKSDFIKFVELQRSPLQKHMKTRRLLRVTNAQRSWKLKKVIAPVVILGPDCLTCPSDGGDWRQSL